MGVTASPSERKGSGLVAQENGQTARKGEVFAAVPAPRLVLEEEDLPLGIPLQIPPLHPVDLLDPDGLIAVEDHPDVPLVPTDLDGQGAGDISNADEEVLPVSYPDAGEVDRGEGEGMVKGKIH
jgi:hypothetical protein